MAKRRNAKNRPRRKPKTRPTPASNNRRTYNPRYKQAVSLNNPFPLVRYARLRYMDEFTLNPGIGTTIANSFRANGMFDPNQTGIGHQPMFFDQMMAIYNHFEVLGSRITATFIQASNVYVGIYTDDDTTFPTTSMAMLEQKGVKYRLMTNAQTNATTIRSNWSQKRTFPKSQGDTALKGNIGADPAEQSYFHVFAGAFNGNDPPVVNVVVKIEYFARFTEIKTQNQS